MKAEWKDQIEASLLLVAIVVFVVCLIYCVYKIIPDLARSYGAEQSSIPKAVALESFKDKMDRIQNNFPEGHLNIQEYLQTEMQREVLKTLIEIRDKLVAMSKAPLLRSQAHAKEPPI